MESIKVVCRGDSGIAEYLVLTKIILYCCILSQFVRRTQNLDDILKSWRQPYQWLFCLNNSNCLFEWRPENKTLIRWTAPENIQYLRRPKTSLAGSHGEVRTLSGWRLAIGCKLCKTRALLLWHLLNQAGLGIWCKLCDKHFCDSTPFLWFHALFPNWQTICFGLQAICCSNLSTLHNM